MICGTPVISSDCVSGPREILAPKSDISLQLKDTIELAKYGVLFPIGDIKSLTKSIQLLLEDINLGERYSQNAQKRANNFTIERIIDKYKEVLEIYK